MIPYGTITNDDGSVTLFSRGYHALATMTEEGVVSSMPTIDEVAQALLKKIKPKQLLSKHAKMQMLQMLNLLTHLRLQLEIKQQHRSSMLLSCKLRLMQQMPKLHLQRLWRLKQK